MSVRSEKRKRVPMRTKIVKFLCLSTEERRLFLEAFWTLGRMKASLLIYPFKPLIRDLHQSTQPPHDEIVTTEEYETAILIEKAIARAAQQTPWKNSCLLQALCATRMFRRRGLPGHFCVGVHKEKESGLLKAHAWMNCSDRCITGRTTHEKFTVLTVFSWPSR